MRIECNHLPFVLLMGVCSAVVCCGGDNPTCATIQGCLDQIVESASTRSYEAQVRAQEWLLAQPPEMVVPAVLRALAENPGFQRPGARVVAYRILTGLRAAQDAETVKRIISDVNAPDPAVQAACISALALASSDEGARVATALIPLLSDAKADPYVKQKALETLARVGRSATDALPIVESLFQDESADEQIRWAAAWAMMSVGGLPYAIEQFQHLDATGLKVVLWALPRHIVEHGDRKRYVDDPKFEEARNRAVAIVHEGLASENLDIRKGAFEALLPVYGPRVVTVVDGRAAWNPRVEEALRHMAATEPDEGLRSRAEGVLEQYDPQRLAERIERIRQRGAERQDENVPDKK